MAGLLGGASGASGAGGMGAAGTATEAAPAASSYGAGTYGVMASNAAPATYPVPQYAIPPSNYVMQSSGAQPYQVPTATGGMYGEGAGAAGPTFMQRLMEYVKTHPSTAPDRSAPPGGGAQQAPPPTASRLLGQSGQYPTLSSLMAVNLPTLQTRV